MRMSEDGTVHLSDDTEQLTVPRALFEIPSFFLSVYIFIAAAQHILFLSTLGF